MVSIESSSREEKMTIDALSTVEYLELYPPGV